MRTISRTVGELVRELRELGRGVADRSVVVGGRWGISNISLADDGLGPVELDLEDVGLDDQGRASISALARYVGELPEFRNLSVAKRAAVIGCLLPPDRDEAVAVANSAVDQRRTD